MARDRGVVTDCQELAIGGSRGVMFKITLTTHGYTVISKGMQLRNMPHLLHEAQFYHQLRSIQGAHIPVCLGTIHLILPYDFMRRKFRGLFFLSYEAWAYPKKMNHANEADTVAKVASAMQAVHKLRVLQCDSEARNVMYDESGAVRIVDFERSKIQLKRPQAKRLTSKRKQPLGVISPSKTRSQPPFRPGSSQPNTQGVGNGKSQEEVKNVEFVTELQDLIQHITYCYPRVPHV